MPCGSARIGSRGLECWGVGVVVLLLAGLVSCDRGTGVIGFMVCDCLQVEWCLMSYAIIDRSLPACFFVGCTVVPRVLLVFALRRPQPGYDLVKHLHLKTSQIGAMSAISANTRVHI